MTPIELFGRRRSKRVFKGENVSLTILEEILRDAANAPSAINMQPWEVNVVIGDELRRLSKSLLKAYRERQITCGPGTTNPIPEKFIDRARECADGMTPLSQQMGLEFAEFVNKGSLNFYGAPAAVLLFLDSVFLPDRLIDMGAFVAYLLLAAEARGIANCPIGLVSSYQDDIKDYLNIDESKSLVLSVALGYEDESAPINRFRAPRIELTEFVRWVY